MTDRLSHIDTKYHIWNVILKEKVLKIRQTFRNLTKKCEKSWSFSMCFLCFPWAWISVCNKLKMAWIQEIAHKCSKNWPKAGVIVADNDMPIGDRTGTILMSSTVQIHSKSRKIRQTLFTFFFLPFDEFFTFSDLTMLTCWNIFPMKLRF